AHRKEDRYPTALALAADVQRYIAGEPVSACPETLLERAWRWAKKHRRALGRSAAALLVVAAAAFGLYQWREMERRSKQKEEEAAEEIRLAKEREQVKAEEAQRLRELDQARKDAQEFRRLADEARYYAANSNPSGKRSPYFDPKKAEEVG